MSAPDACSSWYICILLRKQEERKKKERKKKELFLTIIQAPQGAPYVPYPRLQHKSHWISLIQHYELEENKQH